MSVYEKMTAIADAIRGKTMEEEKLSLDAMARQISGLSPFIVPEVTGETIALTDSSNRKFRGLTLYGKTTQDGTPTPDAPVALVSAGDGGSVGVSVAGKNLFGGVFGANYPLFLPKGTIITASTLIGDSNSYFYLIRENGTAIDYRSIQLVASGRKYGTFTATEDVYYVKFLTNDTGDYQVELGSTATEYEPYKEPQTLPVSTPNGLAGIPVTSGGNYTDSNGQQWICDEVDLARGIRVKHINKLILDATLTVSAYNASTWADNVVCCFTIKGTNSPNNGTGIMSEMFKRVDYVYELKSKEGIRLDANNPNYIYMGVSFARLGIEPTNDVTTGMTALKKYLSENEVIVLYELATPIETPLSADELAAYAALHTNYPNTTIFSDAGVGMKVAYVADTPNFVAQHANTVAVSFLEAAYQEGVDSI